MRPRGRSGHSMPTSESAAAAHRGRRPPAPAKHRHGHDPDAQQRGEERQPDRDPHLLLRSPLDHDVERRGGGPHEPAVGVAVDELRGAQRAGVRDRRLPAVALRLAEHEPERRGRAGHVHAHARGAVVHDGNGRHRWRRGAESGHPAPCHCKRATARRGAERQAVDLHAGVQSLRRADHVAAGPERDRRNTRRVVRIARSDRESADLGCRARAPGHAHRHGIAVDRQQVGTARAGERGRRRGDAQTGNAELGDRGGRRHRVAGRLPRRQLHPHAGDRDPDRAAGHRREAQAHGAGRVLTRPVGDRRDREGRGPRRRPGARSRTAPSAGRRRRPAGPCART